MGQYEQSNSEARHNHKSSDVTASEYLRRELTKIKAEKEREQRHQKNIENHGTDPNAWKKGVKDRLSASAYFPSKDYYESSLYSYVKGYIEEGNRQIGLSITIGMVTEQALEAFYGVSDKNYDPEKYGHPSRKDFAKIHLDDFLYAVGFNDGQGFIEIEDLPEIIKENESYIQGYNDSHKRTK